MRDYLNNSEFLNTTNKIESFKLSNINSLVEKIYKIYSMAWNLLLYLYRVN